MYWTQEIFLNNLNKLGQYVYISIKILRKYKLKLLINEMCFLINF